MSNLRGICRPHAVFASMACCYRSMGRALSTEKQICSLGRPPPPPRCFAVWFRRLGEQRQYEVLLMQSDLDMATGWLSKQINDLELLLRSGVLQHSTAIVLSRPNSASSKEELTFFVRDLFARLQIGGLEFKLKALDSLIQMLIEDSKSAIIVAKEGDMRCFISLLDSSCDDSVRELAVHAVSLLVSAGDLPRKCVFEEGALGPLLRIIECSSVQVKEKAAMAGAKKALQRLSGNRLTSIFSRTWRD